MPEKNPTETPIYFESILEGLVTFMAQLALVWKLILGVYVVDGDLTILHLLLN